MSKVDIGISVHVQYPCEKWFCKKNKKILVKISISHTETIRRIVENQDRIITGPIQNILKLV
jgi:hypothetical protein